MVSGVLATSVDGAVDGTGGGVVAVAGPRVLGTVTVIGTVTTDVVVSSAPASRPITQPAPPASTTAAASTRGRRRCGGEQVAARPPRAVGAPADSRAGGAAAVPAAGPHHTRRRRRRRDAVAASAEHERDGGVVAADLRRVRRPLRHGGGDRAQALCVVLAEQVGAHHPRPVDVCEGVAVAVRADDDDIRRTARLAEGGEPERCCGVGEAQ